MTEPANTVWWVFFPLVGLDITDTGNGLDAPMFGDATLLSKAHIRQIVRQLRLNERMSAGYEEESHCIHMIEKAALKEDFDCLVAVKRRCPGNMGWTDKERIRPGSELSELVERAGHRAAQVASVVALALISESKRWETCGFASQVKWQIDSVTMIAFETGNFAFQMSGRGSHTRLGIPLRVTRAELGARIEGSPAKPISAILSPQKSPAGRSLTRAVGEAAIRLTDALHARSAAAQLLGAVTAIEILIARQGDSYETTKKRIRGLVGEPACEQFEAERVLEERHRYVHRGVEPSHGYLPKKASALALACLIQFAELTAHFQSKNALVTYLDLLHIGSTMGLHWPDADRARFNQLRKHGPFVGTFPYFIETQKAQREGEAPTSASR